MEGKKEQVLDLLAEQDNPKQINKKHAMCTPKTLLLAVVCLSLLAVTITTICLLSFSLRNLDEKYMRRIESLEREVTSLKSILSEDCCSDKEDIEPMHVGMSVRSLFREKRNAAGNANLRSLAQQLHQIKVEESEHIRNEHHGLASSHIALLYGNPDQINITSMQETSINSKLRLRNSTKQHNPLCSRMLDNGKGDSWCLPLSQHQSHMFMLYDESGFYPYFKKADWMNERLARMNFEVTGTDQSKLVVKQKGIYIVTSNVHFAEVQSESLHYGVYKSDQYGHHEQLLSVCAFTANNSGSGGLYPCPTWQLVSMDAEDRVYMKISGFNWFNVDKNFFLAVIKLNDWSLDS